MSNQELPKFTGFGPAGPTGKKSIGQYNSQDSSSQDFPQTQFSPWTNSIGSEENWPELSHPDFVPFNPHSISYTEAMQASQQAAADISASLSEMFTKMSTLTTNSANGTNGEASPTRRGDENLPTAPAVANRTSLSTMRPSSVEARPAAQHAAPQEEIHKTTPTRHLIVDLTSAEVSLLNIQSDINKVCTSFLRAFPISLDESFH